MHESRGVHFHVSSRLAVSAVASASFVFCLAQASQKVLCHSAADFASGHAILNSSCLCQIFFAVPPAFRQERVFHRKCCHSREGGALRTPWPDISSEAACRLPGTHSTGPQRHIRHICGLTQEVPGRFLSVQRTSQGVGLRASADWEYFFMAFFPKSADCLALTRVFPSFRTTPLFIWLPFCKPTTAFCSFCNFFAPGRPHVSRRCCKLPQRCLPWLRLADGCCCLPWPRAKAEHSSQHVFLAFPSLESGISHSNQHAAADLSGGMLLTQHPRPQAHLIQSSGHRTSCRAS